MSFNIRLSSRCHMPCKDRENNSSKSLSRLHPPGEVMISSSRLPNFKIDFAFFTLISKRSGG